MADQPRELTHDDVVAKLNSSAISLARERILSGKVSEGVDLLLAIISLEPDNDDANQSLGNILSSMRVDSEQNIHEEFVQNSWDRYNRVAGHKKRFRDYLPDLLRIEIYKTEGHITDIEVTILGKTYQVYAKVYSDE